MATNRRHFEGRFLELDVSGVNGSGTADLVLSGDPLAIGDIPGVAVTDEDSDGNSVVDTSGVYELSVTGADNVGNAAITAGDIVYWDNTPGEVNVDSVAGTRFGYALEDVASGATTAIKVKVGY